MALTRRALKAMGIDEEKIEEIIAMHTETVDGLKSEVEKHRSDAAELPVLRKKLETAENDLAAANQNGYKQKYDALKQEFAGYKAEQTAKATRAAKEAAYRGLLQQAGVGAKHLDSILRVCDVDSIELDERGAAKEADELLARVKGEWADFIPTTTVQGAKTDTPPALDTGRTYTREEIRRMSPAEINQQFDAIKASLKGV